MSKLGKQRELKELRLVHLHVSLRGVTLSLVTVFLPLWPLGKLHQLLEKSLLGESVLAFIGTHSQFLFSLFCFPLSSLSLELAVL